MSKLLVKMVNNFMDNKYSVVFTDENFSCMRFCLEVGCPETIPYPGKLLNTNEIIDMINFLKNFSRENNEQSHME